MAVAFLVSAVLRTVLERRQARRLVAARTEGGAIAAVVVAFGAAAIVAAACRVLDRWPSSILTVAATFLLVLGLHAIALVATGLLPIRRLGDWVTLFSRAAPALPETQSAPLLHGSSETEVPTPFSE